MMDVKQTKYGFYSLKSLPSEEELKAFYENKYFQEDNSVYTHSYSADELTYIDNTAKVAEYLINVFNDSKNKKLLDVGAGEGYFSNYFFKHSYLVKTLDFSNYAIIHHNPDIKDTLIQGNVFESIEKIINTQEKFDLVNLSNVLEHVIDPIELLKKLKVLLNDNSLLRISVPNDYSEFQQFLLSNDYTTNTWLCPPEHIHYFTFESLENLLIDLGYEVHISMGEFPIELYLANETSNYVKDKAKGQFAHKSRVAVDNFLFEQGIKKYIDFYQASADIGLSRQVIIFAKLRV